MGKVKGKHRLDKFYHLAKEQGYRSRAAYKLVQLDAKYSFLHSSRAVLDLCAAPGGWMQVAVNRVPVGSLVIGVDLFPIRPIRGCISFEEDITKPKCRSTLKKLLSENGHKAFDLVLHDGSPNVGGAWSQEATAQNALVIDSVKLATEFLAPKGTFVTKIFRSQDYNAVLYCLRQLFEKVEVTKPVASRSTSAEIYIIGLKYKAPAKIDPRLLDIKHLFQGVIEPPKIRDIFEEGKGKRDRDGYGEGLTLVRKVCPAADFVWVSKDPTETLGLATSISFDDPSSLPLKDHPLTSEEIKYLCEDLRVLGKQDFKQLLKWRINIQKVLSPTGTPISTSVDAHQKDENVNADVDKEEDDDEQDEDEKLLDEMEKLTHDVERKKKREKKLLAKRRAKDKARKATGMQIDALQDGYVDNELFSLSSIKDKEELATVDATEDVDVADLAGSDDDRHNEADEDSESDDMDSDDERTRYDEHLDKYLDEEYERFVARTDGSTKQRKRAKEAYSDVLLPGGDDDKVDEPDYDSDKDQGDREANPLVVPIDMDKELTQEEIMQRWYSQDIFAEAVAEGDLGKDGSDDDDDEPVYVRKPKLPRQNKAKEGTKSEFLNKDTSRIRSAKKTEDDMEVVPAPVTDSSDSSSDDESEEEYDTDTKCEILAVAKKMLRKRKREEMLDDGYNKRTFDDRGSLPRWFEEDEQKHNQPMKPVTKEEIAAERALFKEINARPAKKVAEAKARKKRAAMRTMEKVRKKANSIADQSDIADRSKRRMIESLYSKAANPKKPKKEYVVAKKGVQVKGGKGKVIVDRRMKSDARQKGMTKDKKGKGKGKGRGKGEGMGKGKGKGGVKSSGRKGSKR